MNTVQLSVNTHNMVNTLKKAFANYSSVIRELAQNSRRAGATEVRFTIDSDTNAVTVTDDGRGIDDMGALLAIASSGWDQSVIEAECAYGMGFLSAIYTADHIDVVSRGKRLSTTTDRILAFECIEIESVPLTGVTTVTLSGGNVELLIRSITESIEENPFIIHFESKFCGFPIRVFINGEEVKRTRALDAHKDWVSLPEAIVHLRAYTHKCGPKEFEVQVSRNWVAYYQGLEIERCYSNRDSWDSVSILHLDSLMWEAVAPDRHMLVNRDEARERIERILSELAKDYLRRFAAQKENEDIVLRSHHVYEKYGLLEIYNRIDRLPRLVVCGQLNYPVREYNDYNAYYLDRFIHREEIERGNTFIFSDEPLCDHDDCFRYAMYMYAMRDRAFWLSGNLHPDHWVHAYCLKAYDSRQRNLIEVVVYGLRELTVSPDLSPLELPPAMVEFFELRGPAGSICIADDAIVVKGNFVVDGIPGHDEVVFIPAKSEGVNTLLQTNGYYWNDQFQEDLYNNHSDRYRDWLFFERLGTQPEKLLHQILVKHGCRFHQLVDRQFVVSFSENSNGKVSAEVSMLNCSSI